MLTSNWSRAEVGALRKAKKEFWESWCLTPIVTGQIRQPLLRTQYQNIKGWLTRVTGPPQRAGGQIHEPQATIHVSVHSTVPSVCSVIISKGFSAQRPFSHSTRTHLAVAAAPPSPFSGAQSQPAVRGFYPQLPAVYWSIRHNDTLAVV